MKTLITLAAAAAMVTTMVFAQGAAQTVKGTLIDNACANPKMSQADLAKHDKSCLQEEECEMAGYAVITSTGALFKFDEKGNTLAKAQIAASRKTDDFKVTVIGAPKGDVFAVTSLTLDK